MDYQIPIEFKPIINKKINTAIVEAIGMNPEAIELSKKLDNIKTYEEYQQYIGQLNKYKVVTNGIGEFIEATTKIIKKTNLAKNEETENCREVEDMVIHSIGENEKGIIYYDKPLTFLSVLGYSRNIWSNKQKLIFIQPTNTIINGKITAEAWRGKKKIPVATGWSYEDEDGIRYDVTYYNMRGLDKKTWTEQCILTQEVYGYRLWDEQNHRDYLVLSEEELKNEEKDGVFIGFLVEKSDKTPVGDELKLNSYANILHISNIRPNTQGILEMQKYPDRMGTTVEDVNNIVVDQESIIIKSLENSIFNKYKHPKWFMNTIYYFLLSYPLYEYPPHLFLFQNGSGGKTTLLINICKTLDIKEADIWSGNLSTLKSLVPSFHQTPPQVGWMPLQRYFGLLDEFFGRQSSNDSKDKLYEYDSIKNMLDSNKSESLSGKGSIKTNATAKFLFSSNLKYGIRDLPSFMDRTDAALVERMLVYFMNKEHESFIQNNREKVDSLPDEPEPFPDSRKFIKHMIIHAQTFKIKNIDYNRIRAIRKKLVVNNSLDLTKYEAIENYVNARMSHHLKCLLDGIVKLRYFSNQIYEGDMTPIEEDYMELDMVSEIISRSWMNDFDIKLFTLDARVRMLSGHARELYHTIREQGGLMKEQDYVAYATNILKLEGKESAHATNQLLTWEVVKQEEGYFKCFWRDIPPKQTQPTTIIDPLAPQKLHEPHDGLCGSCGERRWLEYNVGGNHYCRKCVQDEI